MSFAYDIEIIFGKFNISELLDVQKLKARKVSLSLLIINASKGRTVYSLSCTSHPGKIGTPCNQLRNKTPKSLTEITKDSILA